MRCLPIGALVLLAVAQAAAAAPRQVALADTRLLATAASRQLLKYLASCALDADTVLTATHAGQTLEFPGGLGLAPQWQHRGLDAAQRRWVSACLLARTNHFGVTVQLSLRAAFPSDAPGLRVDDDEARRYTLQEATFFGNLFADRPTAYACGPAMTPERRSALQAQQRVCALPGSDGRSACGFVHVGACTPQAFQQDGTDYHEAITVFLPPGP